MTDFEILLADLDEGDVACIIIGGLAATIHGSSRLTQDIDIVYERSEENIERLVRALAPHDPYLRGAPPGLPFEWSADTIRRGLNFTLTTAVGDIDILGEIVGGGSYDDLLSHTITVALFARTHRCLDLSWLMHVKRAAGRPKDLEVIADLEALLEERGDT